MAVLGAPKFRPPGLGPRSMQRVPFVGGRGAALTDTGKTFILQDPDNYATYVHPAFTASPGFREWVRRYGARQGERRTARGVTFTLYRFADYQNKRLASISQSNWFGGPGKVQYGQG